MSNSHLGFNKLPLTLISSNLEIGSAAPIRSLSIGIGILFNSFNREIISNEPVSRARFLQFHN